MTTDRRYYSISEVSEQVSESIYTLRFWETQFEILSPERSRGGARRYTEADIELIRTIKHLLQHQKLTIEGANNRLRSNKKTAERTQKIVAKLQDVRSELAAIRRELNQTEASEEEVIV
jgi:DNA-binding transcriptional MerR regulator